jgi:hypothetical protein
MPKSQVQIRRSRLDDAESLCDTINSVAREKWWLATADGFTPDQTRAFLKFVTDHSLSQVVAVSRTSARSAWGCDANGAGTA